jgi:hypothetical protein
MAFSRPNRRGRSGAIENSSEGYGHHAGYTLDHNQAFGGQGNSGSGPVVLVGTAPGRAADSSGLSIPLLCWHSRMKKPHAGVSTLGHQRACQHVPGVIQVEEINQSTLKRRLR